MSAFKDYFRGSRESYKPIEVKEWVIARLKKGCRPTQIVKDAEKFQGVSITVMSIWRWRKEYVRVTGEQVHSYREFLKFKKGN